MLAVDTRFERVTTERLEAEVQTLAGDLAAATCRWLLMVAELDRRDAWRSWEVASMAHWLSCKCGVSLTTGRDHVRVARGLEALPLVRERFARGQLSYSKARALCRLVALPEMEADLVEMATVATAAQLDRIAAAYQRALRFADPERDRRNHERRRWSVIIDEDGMATLTVRRRPMWSRRSGPRSTRHSSRRCPTMPARRSTPGESTRSPQWRGTTSNPTRPRRLPPRSYCASTASTANTPMPTNTPTTTPTPMSPCHRPRCTAFPSAARHTSGCAATQRPPSSVHWPTAASSAHRSPTRSLAASVARCERRDLNTCRWPGCTNTAHLHIHHIVFRSRRNGHNITNLVLLCPHHHRVVHLGLWTLTGDANGRLVITGPEGRALIEGECASHARSWRHLARATHRYGTAISEHTIAGAYNEPLHLEWTVSGICANEDFHRRRRA